MANQDLEQVEGFQLPKPLQEVMALLRFKIEVVRKQFLAKERRQCLSVFSDDELWQLREEMIVKSLCVLIVGNDIYLKQLKLEFKLSRQEEKIIAHRFQIEAIQKRALYLSKLATLLERKIKSESANALSEIEKKIFPVPFPQEVEWIKPALVIGFASEYFSSACWPSLPDGDKKLLKEYLEEQKVLLFEQAEAYYQNTLPEKDYRVLQLVKAHFLYGIPPNKWRATFEKGLAKIVPPLIKKVQRGLGLTRGKSKTDKRGRPANETYNRAYKLAIKHPNFSAEELLRRVDPQIGSLSKRSRQYRDKEKCLKQALNERYKKELGKSFNWKARKAKQKKR